MNVLIAVANLLFGTEILTSPITVKKGKGLSMSVIVKIVAPKLHIECLTI